MPPRKRNRRDDGEAQVEESAQAKRPRRATAKGTSTNQEESATVTGDIEETYDLENFPARSASLWKFGPHVSAAEGIENAVLNAANIGATAFALFVKSQRKWESKDLTDESITRFKQRMELLKYDKKHVLPHGNYLVNLGNPDIEKREKSYQCFLDDLKRCEQLGLMLYNFHPGSTVGLASTNECLGYVAQCINRAHNETQEIVIVIENMAGAGNVLGSRFSELGTIIRQVENKERVGVCLDTCHMFAAGYDITTKEGWGKMMAEFEREIGLKYLRGMHLNDSKGTLGSGKDRHQNLGLGHLTLQTFAHVLSDDRTQDIPLILETPAHDTNKSAKSAPKKGKKKQAAESNGEEDDDMPSQRGKDDNWEIWRKEVEVLGRIAELSGGPLLPTHPATGEPTGSHKDNMLEEWTAEIRDLVVRRGGADALTLLLAKDKSKAKTKIAKSRKQKDGAGPKAGKAKGSNANAGSESELTSLHDEDSCAET